MTLPSQLLEKVGNILHTADEDIAARRPICRSSGRCCKFEQYGHRLYVTEAELQFFAAKIEDTNAPQSKIETQNSKLKNPPNVSLPQFFAQPDPEGCPYQIDNLCTAREARPLGCRIYFCDENAQSWQNDVYEKYHAQLKALHEELQIPYQYMEWRTALRKLTSEHNP